NYVKKHIDKLIAVSEFQREDIAAYFDVTPIDVVYNPINTELFQPLVSKPANEKKQFLHISTLDKEVKNPIGIIDAVELLVRKGYHDFELTIVSDESYAELQKYAEQKSLSTYIHFAGPFEHEDLLPFYQKSDAFVLFSNYESFSIVLAEAWSCGLPTLTTPVGIGFNLQAEYGIQVKINDSLSLAMAMEKIIHNHTFDSKVIRAKSQTYSMQNILGQLSTIYTELNG
ncbi:MAG: glycosyltransferase, partial [Crocinitomicaceae bacterium]|nr:glycosyltransferase [Crocinitomicaceae bacterium]